MTERFSAKTTLIKSEGGAYEVVVDGELIYSKKATREFPDEEMLLKRLASR